MVVRTKHSVYFEKINFEEIRYNNDMKTHLILFYTFCKHGAKTE